MRLVTLYFLISSCFANIGFADATRDLDLPSLIWGYFESHEHEVRDFHSRGGHLPDKVDVFFNLIRYQTEDLADSQMPLPEKLEVIRFLRRQILAVSIICAPGSSQGVEEINRHREECFNVVLKLDAYEKQLLSDAKF